MKKYFIGVDISKEKLDICVMKDDKTVEEAIVRNTMKDVVSYIKSLKKKGIDLGEVLLCAEYTGQYGYPLCCACEESGADIWMEDPMQIKQSSGVKRGKDDKADAKKIAQYAARFQDRCRLYSIPEKNITTLRQLMSERDIYVTDRAKYTAQITDQERFMPKDDYKRKSKRMNELIDKLDDAIRDIDEAIDDLFKSDGTMMEQKEILKSIEGVGERTALKMIVTTRCFTQFSDSRQFCCYAGIAPFEYMSGSSVRSRRRVSQRADKSVKSLLHMAALQATKPGHFLHDYYIRKVGEGKNKMSILNAIRAKLVHTMFSLIRRNMKFDKNYKNSFVMS